MSNATDIMNKAIELAIENGQESCKLLCEERGWQYKGGAHPAEGDVETEQGRVTCLVTQQQSR